MHEPFDEEQEEEATILDIENFAEKFPFAYEIEVHISELFSKQNVKAVDILMLIRNLMARSRAVLTFDELHAWSHKLLKDAEYLLQTGQAFVTEEGEPINMLLAEEREELGTNKFNVPDTVPEDWE